MRSSDQLAEFVRAALVAGESRAGIEAALTRSGWSAPEVAEALAGWDDPLPGMPPAPRARPVVTAREVVLYGMLFISLGLVTWHLTRLGFGIIDALVPDPTEWYPTLPSMRWSIAVLIAFLPVFLFLDRYVTRADGVGFARRKSVVRRWFASVTLLIAALALLGDVVASVYAVLSGELTLRFALKAMLVAVTGALVLTYYRGDLDG